MDHARSTSGNAEDNVGIPDDLRCKRSDGKQWRCTAMSMPDKTVCEKHYIQAKKRAANSAMRASLKKAKRKSLGESDIYLESKSDDVDMPLASMKVEQHSASGKNKASKNQFRYTAETPTTRTTSGRNAPKLNDDSQDDIPQYEENWMSYESPPASRMDLSRKRSQRNLDVNAATGYSDGSTDSSEETGGQTCHQCRRNDRDRIIWCLRCDRRGYCESCILTWYSDMSLDEIQMTCPACRGTCNCKICLRGDNSIKVRIREIPVLDKLQYLHVLLSSVLPVVKQIHHEQCYEVELEKKLRGIEIDLPRTKLNADEQMCCNFCRIPITDYHRHCPNCTYDLCLNCCQDLREADVDPEKITPTDEAKLSNQNLLYKLPDWRSNSDDSIPCPPKKYGGCGYSPLNLSRIFKMNWVAKLVKNAEEMVSGCQINEVGGSETNLNDLKLYQYSHREASDDNFLYCPASEDLKTDGIGNFRKHWKNGEPIIVKQVFDRSSSWDPMAIWSGVRETADEKMKEAENRVVKAMDCLTWSEIDIELNEFMKGYFEGRTHENGLPQLLKLKDWPSPSASEEFLLHQRPEFIRKLPLLEYIHSKWGLLNVAAKLPHYSLQNDVGPKIYISYGVNEELGSGDSVTNLHFNMRDMVYLLVHTSEVKPKNLQGTKSEKIQKSSDENELPADPQICSVGSPADSSLGTEKNGLDLDSTEKTSIINKGFENYSSAEGDMINSELPVKDGDVGEETDPGVLWDVFRRQDVPKLTEFLKTHWKEFARPDDIVNKFDSRPLYDGVIFLNRRHKRKLKEEFGVEPWSFEQCVGKLYLFLQGALFKQGMFRLHLLEKSSSLPLVNRDSTLSTVQLGLDFLSPESLVEAVRLAEDVRCLPNEHEAKHQVLEVGKISLYAASSAIKEVQKLVLDPKLGAEIGVGDPKLTAMVAENYEKMVKRRQISCA